MITTSLIFDRKKKAGADNPGLIELRITVNRTSYYISTRIRVVKRKWKNGRIVNTSDANELNERLELYVKRANQYINNCINDGIDIDSSSLRCAVFPVKSSVGSFADWLESEIKKIRVSTGTRKHYKTLMTRMGEFGRLRQWSDLTVENIYAWDDWLHGLRGTLDKKISDAAVFNYHKMLRALIERAKRVGRVQLNPYDRLRGEFKRGEKVSVEYLTDDEMDAIRRLPYRPRTELGKARDLFVFQAYTGMSYSDALAFNINNYKRVGGRWLAVGQRIKTGTAYISELLPPVVEVLEAYGWKVPRMSNQVYNRVLKIVGEDACISTPLHSHLARHTFATMMLAHGVKIQNVAKMLGHTNITQTQRYAKVIAQSVREDYEMISQILTQKTKQHEKTTIPALAGVSDADGLQQN